MRLRCTTLARTTRWAFKAVPIMDFSPVTLRICSTVMQIHVSAILLTVRLAAEAGALRRTELNVLQKVHHPHATQFLGAVTTSQPYMLVYEFLPGGSLLDMCALLTARDQPLHALTRAQELGMSSHAGRYC